MTTVRKALTLRVVSVAIFVAVLSFAATRAEVATHTDDADSSREFVSLETERITDNSDPIGPGLREQGDRVWRGPLRPAWSGVPIVDRALWRELWRILRLESDRLTDNNDPIGARRQKRRLTNDSDPVGPG